MAIEYSDGSAIEAGILARLQQAPAKGSEVSIARADYGEWPVRYHLSPERSNLFRHLDFSGLEVLELGAGMGAISRFLAENSARLTVIEGAQPRLDALSSRLADLGNWKGVLGNVQDVVLEEKFDVVCVIGVLEYAELYIKGTDPHLAFLKKALSFLKPGGVLLLAIENAIGLKYWAGSPEDHTGRLFDSLCGYPEAPTPRTFCWRPMKAKLAQAGLTSIDTYFPFPDYKLPKHVATERCLDAFAPLAADLAGFPGTSPQGAVPLALFPESLVAAQIAQAGVLAEMSSSFLFLATSSADSSVRRQLRVREERQNEVAWSYSLLRHQPTRTCFTEKNAELYVEKEPLHVSGKLSQSFQGPDLKIIWSVPLPGRVASGENALRRAVRTAYFQEAPVLAEFISKLLKQSLKRWRTSEGLLAPESLDATFANLAIGPQDHLEWFDLEWRVEGGMPASWYVLRLILSLQVLENLTPAVAPFRTWKEFYLHLCAAHQIEPALEKDLAREAQFQSLVAPVGDLKSICQALSRTLHRRRFPARFPRRARRWERHLGRATEALRAWLRR